MAVQQNKSSRAKRGMRRSHDVLIVGAMSVDMVSGEMHRRHHVTNNGSYRGYKIITNKK